MDYEKRYNDALERARKLCDVADTFTSYDINTIFPELQDSEGERIRKWLIVYFQQYRIDGMEVVYADSLKVDDILAWLERQKPVDEEELKKGALKYVARQFMSWLDAKIPNDKMCLSNMECKAIEDAFLKDDWARISHYMRKKLDKQDKVLDPDKVIEWLKTKVYDDFSIRNGND